MWEKIQADLEQGVNSAIDQNANLPLYLWTFDGDIAGRGPGLGWLIQAHFEDPAQEGGVKHVTIGSGPLMNQELSDTLKVWFMNASQRYPGKLAPRIDVSINS